jgi:hypothetical protein
MSTSTRTTVAAVATILAIGFTSATAFELINPPRKWFQGQGGAADDLPVSLLVYAGGESSVADADNGVTAVQDAAEAWEPEVQSNVNLLSMGTTGANTIGRDGANTVSFEDPGRIVRNALAVTLVGWVDDSQTETINDINFIRYDESDISFSKRTDFTTAAIGNCNDEWDIQAVMTHEVGHFLGLAHSASGAALMAPSIGACSFKPLNSDDIDGINTIYTPGYGGGTDPGCTPTESRLAVHSCSSPSRGPNCLEITVGFVDDCGDPVAGATVTVQLEGLEAGDVLTGSAATGADGSVTFGLRCRDASSTTYVSTVIALDGGPAWSSGDPDNTADASINCVITR